MSNWPDVVELCSSVLLGLITRGLSHLKFWTNCVSNAFSIAFSRMSKMTLCSTPLGHQMLPLGGQLIWWGQVIWKVDLILFLDTICQHRGSRLRVHLVWKYELTSEFTLASQMSFLRKTNKLYMYCISTFIAWKGTTKIRATALWSY